MNNLITAIPVKPQKGDYSRMPGSTAVINHQNAGGDFTFGTHISALNTDIVTGYSVVNNSVNGKPYDNCNAEVLNILTANGAATPTPECNPTNKTVASYQCKTHESSFNSSSAAGPRM